MQDAFAEVGGLAFKRSAAEGGQDLLARVARMHVERDLRKVREHGRGVAALVERDVDDLTQLRTRLPLVPKPLESLVVRVESTTIGPEGKEQHPRDALLSRGELGVVRLRTEKTVVGLSPARVVDVRDCPSPARQLGAQSRLVAVDQPGTATQRGPPLVGAQHLGEVDAGFVEERAQILGRAGAQFRDEVGPPEGEVVADVAQHLLLDDAVEDDLAAGRQEREALLDVALQVLARRAGERPEAQVSTEFAAVMPNEVEGGEHGLAFGEPESAAELLEEEGWALGGAQEEHGVDLGDVDSLVEKVGGKDRGEAALSQVGDGSCALIGRGLSGDGLGRDAGVVGDAGHVFGVGDADAEAECSHPGGVGDLVLELLEDEPGAGVVAGVEAVEVGVGVSAGAPVDRGEVGAVGDAEVVERAEQVSGDRVPDAQLSGGAAVEERADVGAVGALGGRGEAEEFTGLKVVEEPSVGGRLGVVELVDDDDIEGIRGDLGDAAGERLDAGEDVPPLARDVSADVQLTERAVTENLAVSAQ